MQVKEGELYTSLRAARDLIEQRNLRYDSPRHSIFIVGMNFLIALYLAQTLLPLISLRPRRLYIPQQFVLIQEARRIRPRLLRLRPPRPSAHRSRLRQPQSRVPNPHFLCINPKTIPPRNTQSNILRILEESALPRSWTVRSRARARRGSRIGSHRKTDQDVLPTRYRIFDGRDRWKGRYCRRGWR